MAADDNYKGNVIYETFDFGKLSLKSAPWSVISVKPSIV